MTLFSIGYATKPIDILIGQLGQHGVTAVADVRSVPYSKVFPEYHRESLRRSLLENDIQYVYLGEELGPRSKDKSHYDDTGQVQFDRLMKSGLFHQGIERLQAGIDKQWKIALLCAEKDPAICHRSLLIGHYLNHSLNVNVQHICHDGELEAQTELEKRLVLIHRLQEDLLTTGENLTELAYQKQLSNCAYRKPE